MQKAKLIERARQQRDSARILVVALPEMLPELSKIEQEHLVMALIPRIRHTRKQSGKDYTSFSSGCSSIACPFYTREFLPRSNRDL